MRLFDPLGLAGSPDGVQVALSWPTVPWGLLKGGTSIIWHCAFGGGREYWFFFREGLRKVAHRVGGAWRVVGS